MHIILWRKAMSLRKGVLERRHFMGVSGGAVILAATGDSADAQAPSATPPPVAGRVTVERLPDGVLMIGIDRAQAQNRLTPGMLVGLGKALSRLDHDDELRVAVLYGVGADFCLGIDLPAFAAAQAAGLLPPKDEDFVNPLGLRPPYRAKPLVVAL